MNRMGRSVVVSMIVMCLACAGPATTGRNNEVMRRSMSELDAGTRLYQRGCYHQSLSCFFRAFEWFTSFDKREGAAMCLNNIGNVYSALNDINTAILFYDEAVAAYAGINDQQGVLHALGNKAIALTRHNHLPEAEATLSQAEKLAGRAAVYPMLLVSRGTLAMKQQYPDKAEKLLRQALDHIDPQNTPAMAAIHFTLGELMMKTDRHAASVFCFQEALRYDRQMHFRQGVAKDLACIGDAKAAIGKPDEAMAYYKRSLMIYALLDRQEEKDAVLKKLEAVAGTDARDMPLIPFLLNYWDKNGSDVSVCN